VEQGWEGYCLEKDPLNENVCLLWYPIDAIVGSSADNLSSNFSGFPLTGSTPLYCAQMNANFDLVEYRDVFMVGMGIGKEKGTSDNYSYRYIATGSTCISSDYYLVRNKRTDMDNGPCQDTFGTDVGAYLLDDYYYHDMSFCIPKKNSDTHLPIISISNGLMILGKDVKIQDLKGGDNTRTITCGSSNNPTGCDDCNNLSYYSSGTTVREEWRFYAKANFQSGYNSGAGWYKYNGILSNSNAKTVNKEHEIGLRLLAYGMTQVECETSGIYDYSEGSTSIPAKYFHPGNGNDQCPLDKCNDGKGACLMHPDKYVPKCNFIVKGDVPWVSRLKSSPYSFKEYQSSLPNYLNYYSLSSKNTPFGAINSPTMPAYDVYVNQVNTNPQSPYYYHGLPLSCTGTGTVYMNGSWRNPCEALRYDSDGKIKLTLNTSDSNRFSSSANLNIARDSLKYVFAKISSNSGFNYDHTLKGSTPASVCNTAGCPPRESDINICSVYPQIENVKMSGPSGQINQMVREDGIPSNIYNIVSGGFYTLSFNTFVDSEQAPIKKLFIKIKRVDDSWEQVPNIVLSNIDHRPDSLNPHRLVKFLSPGQYIVLIKVIDNWDFFKCYGMGAFANTNSSCYRYCCGALIDGNPAYLENPFSEACGVDDRCTENNIRGVLPVCN